MMFYGKVFMILTTMYAHVSYTCSVSGHCVVSYMYVQYSSWSSNHKLKYLHHQKLILDMDTDIWFLFLISMFSSRKSNQLLYCVWKEKKLIRFMSTLLVKFNTVSCCKRTRKTSEVKLRDRVKKMAISLQRQS